MAAQVCIGRVVTRWRKEHIYVLELQTVYLALSHYLTVLKHKHVLIQSDNIVACESIHPLCIFPILLPYNLELKYIFFGGGDCII